MKKTRIINVDRELAEFLEGLKYKRRSMGQRMTVVDASKELMIEIKRKRIFRD